MNIRLATVQDMDAILAIYAYARTQMKNNHNPHQWGDHHPAMALLLNDIQTRQLYLLCEESAIRGVFAFILGEDPTYPHIEDGAWLTRHLLCCARLLCTTGRQCAHRHACGQSHHAACDRKSRLSALRHHSYGGWYAPHRLPKGHKYVVIPPHICYHNNV